MTLDELEQWEAEVKLTCLIDPVKFNELDLLDLVNMRFNYDDPNWNPLDTPILEKIVRFHICHGTKSEQEFENEYYSSFYIAIQHLKQAGQTKYHGNARYRELIDEYKKWKQNLTVEQSNGKLSSWFNRTAKTG